MRDIQIYQWLVDAEYAQDLYRNSEMKVSQIARLIRRSEGTVHKMIDGKYPKYVDQFIKAVEIAGRLNDKS